VTDPSGGPHPPGGILGAEPRAGVCLHFTSLPGGHGIGDIGDAALAFLDDLCAMRLRVWQFLPVGPTGYGDSPYQSLSTFAGNEMLVGLDPLVREGLLQADELGPLARLPRATVDYAGLIPGKRALLDRAAARLVAKPGAARAEFEEFRHRHRSAWLRDYALFRVLKTLHGERAWPEWGGAYVHREPEALRRIEQEHAAAIRDIEAAQFLFDRQWQRLRDRAGAQGIRLFGDLPMYIALDSADAWSRPDLLQIDPDGRPTQVAGVPPDYFSADGQLWGNPLYDWAGQAATGFDWWIGRVAAAAARCDLLRVDHFRGFESYWAVPRGAATARNGAWRPGPRDALFEALEDVLGRLPIVAEDLGVITREVAALRHRHAIPGMRVLQFELADQGFRLADIAADCVCYTGTHDNDTTLGWFRGSPGDLRTQAEVEATRQRVLEFTGGAPETVAADLIRLAFDSPARLAIAPMQDFLGLGSEARLNRPGTTQDNWRWRLAREQLSPAFLDTVAGWVESSSR